MAELHAVHGTTSNTRRGDVVFVHGLNGHPFETWSVDPPYARFWPRWVGEAIPDLGVWTLEYENAAFKQRRFSFLPNPFRRMGGFAMSLTDRARSVLLTLDSAGIGALPLVFVTHSMGGLLIKQVLRIASERLTSASEESVLRATRGVCFIATPHHGAQLADWVHYFRFFLGPNVSTDDLRTTEPALRELYVWYRNFASTARADLRTISFYETKPHQRIGRLVVEPGNADPGVAHADILPIEEDHEGICRPKNNAADLVSRTVAFIRETLSENHKLPLRNRSFERDETQIDADTTLELLILQVRGTDARSTEITRNLLRLVIINGMRPVEAGTHLGLEGGESRRFWLTGKRQFTAVFDRYLARLSEFRRHLL